MAISVRLLGPEDAGALAAPLSSLVNRVYAIAETGLWRDGAERTTPDEIAGFIRAGEIAVAEGDGVLAGGIRVHDLGAGASEFGILVAAPERRGVGIGRDLVAFAERLSRERGGRTMRLELLLPREWSHPSKEFLADWYGRIGYRRVATSTLDAAYPHLAPLLATPCDLAIYEKPLS